MMSTGGCFGGAGGGGGVHVTHRVLLLRQGTDRVYFRERQVARVAPTPGLAKANKTIIPRIHLYARSRETYLSKSYMRFPQIQRIRNEY